MRDFKSVKWVDDILERYEIGERLGQGSFGTVNKCKKLATNTEHAIKYIEKESLSANEKLPELLK